MSIPRIRCLTAAAVMMTAALPFRIPLQEPLFAEPQAGGSEPSGYSVSIGASVEPKRVPLNRPVTVTVRLTWEGALDSVVIGEATDPALSNLEVVGTSTRNATEGTTGGSRSVKEIQYTLRPKSLGMGYIDSVAVAYQDLKSGATHVMRTGRLSVEAVQPVPEKARGKGRWWLILLAVCFCAGAAGGAALYRRSRTRQPAASAQPAAPTIEETALETIRTCLGENRDDPSAAFQGVSKAFRQYLSQKFGVSALEATTPDLIAALRGATGDETMLRRCEAFLEKADVIKFSGRQAPPHELDDAVSAAQSLLEFKLAEEQARLQRASEEATRRQADETLNPIRRLIRRWFRPWTNPSKH
jgi:hypothetical protein